jgi:hypothetical protein
MEVATALLVDIRLVTPQLVVGRTATIRTTPQEYLLLPRRALVAERQTLREDSVLAAAVVEQVLLAETLLVLALVVMVEQDFLTITQVRSLTTVAVAEVVSRTL